MSDSIDAQMAQWRTDALDLIVHKVSKIDTLIDNQRRQEVMLERLADAVGKLAVIEERQNHDRAALERAFSTLADMSKKHDASTERVMQAVERVVGRVDLLEEAEAMNKQVRYWLLGAITIIVTAVLYAVLNKVGLQP